LLFEGVCDLEAELGTAEPEPPCAETAAAGVLDDATDDECADADADADTDADADADAGADADADADADTDALAGESSLTDACAAVAADLSVRTSSTSLIR
jgi:hypothetical protein